MKEFVFTSHNKDKLAEIRKIFGEGFTIKGLDDIGCFEEIPETAETLKGNAEIKAMYVKEKYNYDCFADDTGLEVEALGGAPGVYSARFAGEDATYEDNCNKLVSEMKDKQNRNAKFTTVICLVRGDEKFYFEGNIHGKILKENKGSGGFGYDPVFLPNGHYETLAEMSSEKKNSISHRYNAVKKLVEFMGI